MVVMLAAAVAGCYGGPGVSQMATPGDPPPVPPPKPIAVAPSPVSSSALTSSVVRTSGSLAAANVVETSGDIETSGSIGTSGGGGTSYVAAEAVERVALGTKTRAPAERSHVVRRGETLYRIARRYEVPLEAMIAANRLEAPYLLAVGQRLAVPAARTVSASRTRETDVSGTTGSTDTRSRTYEVRRGDTIYGIARRAGVDMRALARLNQISPPYTISPGQVLALPAPAATRVAVAAGPEDDVAASSGAPTQVQAAAVRVPAIPAPAVRGPIPEPPPRTSDRFLWPVDGRLSLEFGPKDGGLHNDGINIAAPRGAPIRAAEDGVVAYTGNQLRGFGNLLLIRHGDGWMTAYAHTEAILVGRGERVRRGQVVARVGDSGHVSEPQLHFEIRQGTRAVDPMRLLTSTQAAQNL